MPRLTDKLSRRRWVDAVRLLLTGCKPLVRAAKKRRTVRLLVEQMEDRLTPTQIGQFSFAPNNDYTNTNNSPTNDTFDTVAGGSQGLFQFQNIANLPSFLTGALSAHLVLTTTTTSSATQTAGLIDQPFTTSETVQVLLNTPAPYGANGKVNLITATFTGDLTSEAGTASANLNSTTVIFSSDFLDFSNTTNDAFSIGYSNMETLGGSPTVSSIVGAFINSFTAAGTATFSTTPVAPLIGADLAITKAGPGTVAAGGSMSYTYTVTNNGPVVSGPVTWTDNLPSGETFASQSQLQTADGVLNNGSAASAAAFTLGNTATSVTDTIPSLAVDSSYTFTVTVNIADSAFGTLVNTATISQNSTTVGDPDSGNNTSPPVDTVVTTDPTLTLGKTGPAAVLAGNQMSYVLTVTNTSTQTATNVDVTDPLPAGEVYVSQSQGGGPTFTLTHSGSSISDTISSLAPGASQTITVTVKVPANTSSSTVYTNTGNVAWNSSGDNPGSANSPPVTTTVGTSADLGVTKTATPVILQNGKITYTIQVTNHGPSDAQSVAVTDPLPAGTVFVSDSGATGWTTSDPAAGTNGTIDDTIATLAAGATATFTIVVTDVSVAAPAAISNTATVSSSTTDPTPGNNSATASTTVELPASLSGTVFEDVNDDGVENGADAGLSGVGLTLVGSLGNTYTTTTLADGTYSFTNLVPDTYTLTETGPISPLLQGITSVGTDGTTDGTLASPAPYTPTVNAIHLASGDAGINYDFAAIPSVSVQGVVFDNSAENDGAFHPATDPGINGVTVTLTGTNDEGAAVNLTTTTATLAGQAGAFAFAGLRPSNGSGYTLTETQPASYVQGKFDTPGSPLFGGSATQSATQDVVSGIVVTLTGNTSPLPVTSEDYLFPEIEPASLSGLVYADNNDTGTFDTGDTGINGVTVTLTGTDLNGNTVHVVTSTSGAGAYSFTNLEPSNAAGYTITESQPAPYLEGTDTLGSLSGNAPTQDVFSAIPVAIGASGTGYNFGEVPPSKVAGLVYLDKNADGTFDAGDTGINGVTVTLTGTNVNGATVSTTTTTSTVGGQAGSYAFAGLYPSNAAGYTVTETQPSGYLEGRDTLGTLSGNATVQDVFSAVSVGIGVSGTGYNFGELQASSVSGVLFDNSAENDGVFHSATDPGINGVTITLTGTDDQGNAVNLTTTTSTIAGQAGAYTFTGLRPSNGSGYTITDTNTGLPVGYITGKNQNTGTPAGTLANTFAKTVSAIDVGNGVTGVNYNFGDIEPDSLSGTVYIDTNHTGSFAPTDPGINGVTVTLTGTDDQGNPVNLTTTTSTVAGQAGSYSFTGLRPSNGSGYQLTETQPAAFAQGTDTVGTPFGGSGPVQTATKDTVSSVAISAGNASGVNYNFGELGTSLAGSVFVDTNTDGLREAGEPGINGVTITLTGTDAAGNPVNVTTTTGGTSPNDGDFLFQDLPASSPIGYTLTETQPSGYLEGEDNAGTFGGHTNVQDVISKIVVPSGTSGVNYTFGELPAAQLSGVVFDNSAEADGTFHPATDPGIDGVTVSLTGTDINGNPVSLTTTTATLSGRAGSYSFTGLQPSNSGGYTITETQPTSYLEGGDQLGTAGGSAAVQDVFSGIQATYGTAGTGYNFGELKPVQLSGVVFDNSEEDDGTFHPATDPGINGVTVTLTGTDVNGNPVSLTTTTATLSGQAGSYSFTGLEPSNAAGYTLTETQPSAYLEGGDQLGTLSGNASVQDVFSAIPTTYGSAGTGYNYGEISPATLSGFVYIDVNNNGVKDPAEPGISGVTVTLTGTNDLGQPVSLQAPTAPDGSFSFTNLRPSNAAGYAITETQPSGFLEGLDTAGTLSGNTTVQDVISGVPVSAGNTGTNYLFGEKAFSSLSGFVYADLNNNGVKDFGEPPISGVALTLTGTDILGNPVNVTSTTNAQGAYSFANLLPSNASGYTLTEPQPAQYADGKDAIGTGAAPPGTETQTGNPDVISGIGLAAGNNGINYDFGEIGASISGTAYLDSNDTGTLDSGEPGIGGVAVTLFNSGTPVATTTTLANGTYSFVGLPGGTYTIVETKPNGYGFSSPTTLTNVTAAVAATVTGENFGNTLGSISGVVYVDVNNNGTRDSGEPPVAGALVTLTGTDVNGEPVDLTASSALDGTFTFSGLLAGTYSLSEAQPAGYTNGKNQVGSAGGTQGTQNANPSLINTISLAQGFNGVNYEFGEIGTVLSGRVFLDANDNGVLNTGESGITGVKLSLLNSAGSVVAFTTTGPDGSYSFAGLTPGATYGVTEAVPSGYGTSTPTTIASLTVPAAGLSGENFGLIQGSISGFVYVDANKSGARTATDPGIAGVTLTLTGTNALGASVDLTTTTSGAGAYSFSGLMGGTYTVTETQPSGFTEGKDTSGSLGGSITVQDVIGGIPLSGGAAGTTYNFGEVNPSGLVSLSGSVFNDTNDNGVLDSGESGHGGVTITLTATGKATKTTTTAANGTYLFTGLTPGTYTITETVPSGYNNSSPTVLSSVAVAAPGVTGKNFGLTTGSLSGTVYLDSGNTGSLQSGDPGIPGVTVTLSGAASATTTTGPNGTYSFSNLPAGTYTITEAQPTGYAEGKDTAGTSGGATTVQDVISSITLAAGAQGTGYNFGELTSGLSGTVYVDLNSNGAQESGEPGLAGVTVTITGPVTRSTLTGFNGSFSFSDLLPGTYTLTETQPAGYTTTLNRLGTAGGSPNPAGTSDTIGCIVLAAGTLATGYFFGENAPVIAGTVYLDANANSTLDSGDTGIGGDTLTLTDTTTNQVVATTTTGKDGSYLFLVPSPGDSYTVTDSQPAGYGTSERPTNVDALGAVSTSVVGQNFGKTLGSISGTVYADNNINGTQDGGEPGIPGAVVKLTGTDVNGNTVSLSTVTDASGNYTFSGLLAPSAAGYTITQTVPAGDYPGLPGTTGTSGATTNTATQFTGITLTGGVSATGYKFGDIPPADPFGFVYLDANDNGVKDPGESGIAGVKVTISGTAFAGTALARPLVASDDPSATPLVRTTNASGLYEFLTLPPGVYTLTETPPAGYIGGALQNADPLVPPARLQVVISTTPAAPSFSSVQLVSGDVRGAFNFAELPAGSLSGKVFVDANADGVYDKGDLLEKGVTITLTGTDYLGDPVKLTTTTNTSGVYSFSSLLPSTAAGYKITMTTPAGLLVGKAFVGSLGGSLGAGNVGPITVVLNTTPDVGTGYDFSLLPAGKRRLIGA